MSHFGKLATVVLLLTKTVYCQLFTHDSTVLLAEQQKTWCQLSQPLDCCMTCSFLEKYFQLRRWKSMKRKCHHFDEIFVSTALKVVTMNTSSTANDNNLIKMIFPFQWTSVAVMLTLSSLVAPDVIVMITAGANNDDKVGIMATPNFQRKPPDFFNIRRQGKHYMYKYYTLLIYRGHFSPSTYNKHPIARPWGWAMGCFLCVPNLHSNLHWLLHYDLHPVETFPS